MKIRFTTRLKLAFLIIVLIEFVGTIGFFLLEQQNWTDSFWITTMVVTGIGAEGFVPATKIGKIFMSIISFLGIGAVVGSIVYIFGPIVYDILKEVSGVGGVRLSSLSHHAIICGYNAIAEAIIQEFEKTKEPFVIISSDQEEVPVLLDEGIPAIYGDASRSEVLKRVRIDTADVLIAVEDEDNANALIVLTARHLNRKVRIVGKVDSEENINKLINAGADSVLCPAVIGGKEIARISLKLMKGKKVKTKRKTKKREIPGIEVKIPKVKIEV